MYESSLCSCGHPINRAHNEDMEGYYSKVERLCQACRVIELAQADDRPEAGRKVGVVDDSYGEGFEPDPRFLSAGSQ
ncbi:hypothetical protein ACPPVT_07480 [Angustibacter sp. McL0619]|uniref:hypothetical protein n=1 Tax=Angustibacter sp. McL0619 TaxID=3415676 RepID=UPI003CF0C7A5